MGLVVICPVFFRAVYRYSAVWTFKVDVRWRLRCPDFAMLMVKRGGWNAGLLV